MAYWNSRKDKIIYFKAEKHKNGWWLVDCGCSGGLKWNHYAPVECDRCGGTGSLYWHKKSKTYAMYPGGPLCGRGDLTELEKEGRYYEEDSDG